ncbi:hypothetical protein BIY29_14545 [Brenneria alni]|uniref:DUF2589 domain-containing protein n=1 Tax=Brenneria alni TaxID=71656 RepID=A0A421DLD1_9GAMM|nr:DUF2589 domain-containing protein [Brenneria alni]RLM20986.1 hypothetical protein BIY29_14545 [Brenneria alni]
MSFKSWLTGRNKANNPLPQDNEPKEQAISSGPITLAAITRGMQHAATAANELIAHQYKQALDPFFEHESDGALTPKTIAIRLDGKRHIELPLVALSTPRGLMLEKMKVNMTVRADSVHQDEIQPPLDNHAISNFHLSVSPSGKNNKGRNSQHIDIEMQFVVLEPPESIMRLIDEYTHLVLPQTITEIKSNG